MKLKNTVKFMHIFLISLAQPYNINKLRSHSFEIISYYFKNNEVEYKSITCFCVYNISNYFRCSVKKSSLKRGTYWIDEIDNDLKIQ